MNPAANSRPLTKTRLSWKGLVYHRRSYVAVFLSTATAAAVVAGALIVGDSVRGSLEARVHERLGRVDYALVGPGFFRSELAGDLLQAAAVHPWIDAVVPIVAVRGTVVHEESGRRAGEVNLFGVREDFWTLSGEGDSPLPGAASLQGRHALANTALASTIQAQSGDVLLVHTEQTQDVPSEYALGGGDEEVRSLRLQLGSILPDRSLALFDLEQSQRAVRNIFVPLETLQRALQEEARVNALLVSTAEDAVVGERDAELAALLSSLWRMEDAGLTVRADADRSLVTLASTQLLITDEVAAAARAAAREMAARGSPVKPLAALTYLANTISVGGRDLPYSTVTALGPWEDPSGANLTPLPGVPVDFFRGRGEIVLNEWAASDLAARPGDAVTLKYYVLNDEHEREEAETTFRLRQVIELAGPAADPGWTPTYPGITDADSYQDWDAPFPIDHRRVRDKDEQYWDDHRATPKAYVALGDGQSLWGSRFGNLTGVRLLFPEGEDIQRAADEFARTFSLPPERVGVRLRPVKREGITAARSGTDFTGLFVGFSFFLIVAALVLLSLVFRLSCERRVRELGILGASGFPRAAIRNILLREACVLMGGGVVVGTVGGLFYAAALMAGLRGWWRGAVNAPFLELHVRLPTLSVAALITMFMVVATIFWSVRRLSRLPVVRLLTGEADEVGLRARGRSRLAFLCGAVAAMLGTATLFVGLSVEAVPAAAAFFGAGALFLIAGVALASFLLSGRPPSIEGRSRGAAVFWLGVRNWSRRPARYVLTVALLACATFTVVAVSASRRETGALEPRRESGDGGFALVARSAQPLLQSLGTKTGREELALSADAMARLGESRPYAFRVRPGDDASCLNLYRPQTPRLLGARREFRNRGGFAWSGSLAQNEAERENPWLLLDRTFEDGAVPAVADASTVQWILHSRLGGDIEVTGDRGQQVTLRLVGLLSHSIFQGELVVSEEAFLEHFPSETGHRFFLFETSAANTSALGTALEADLSDHGFDTETPAELLASYRAVENTYLSTFQLLGGLGVILGTLGLAAVLYRNTIERRGELALLRAVGFSQRALGWMVVSETAFLLVLGVCVGAAAALMGVLPNPGAIHDVPWGGLTVTLVATVFVGLLAASVSVRAALAVPLLPALKEER